MRTQFTKIPKKLQGVVVGFGGSLPGVGKSYTLTHWAEKFKSLGYHVVVTGSTNKASHSNKTIYSIADWTDRRYKHKFVRQEGKVFPEKNSIIMIDEAWFLDQHDVDSLRRQFPKCLILLFGDPNQFPPIEDSSLLTVVDSLSPYTPRLGELKTVVKKGLTREPISNVDYMYNLTTQHRVSSIDLTSFLANIKSGFSDMDSVLSFFTSHRYTGQDISFAICRTWQGKNGVYSYGNYRVDGLKRTLLSLKQGVTGVYVGQNNIGCHKNDLYDPTGLSYDTDQEIDVDAFLDTRNFQLQGAVTCHSIQGSTFREGTKILIDVDDAMSIVTPELYEDFARFLYIACSRVRRSEDIYIKCDDLQKLIQIMSAHVGLHSELGGEDTSSDQLAHGVDPIEELLAKASKKEETPRVVSSSKSRKKFDVGGFLLTLVHLGYKEDIYRLSELKCFLNKLTYKQMRAATGVSEATIAAHKADIVTAFSHLELYIQEKKVYTTGRTIGEIMREEEESKEKGTVEYALTLVEQVKDKVSAKTYNRWIDYIATHNGWTIKNTEFVEDMMQKEVYWYKCYLEMERKRVA